MKYKTSLTPSERTLRARLAAHESWAKTTDRAARTSAGYKASPSSVEYWLDKVDPDGLMTEEARLAAAESKRKAHMTSMAFKAAKARGAKKVQGS